MVQSTSAEEDCIERFENYGILARLFRIELDEALLADLVKAGTVEPDGGNAFNEGYGRMRAYLDAVEDLAAAKSELAIDYSLVFLGYGVNPDGKDEPSKLNAAYPYESVYTTGKKTLTGGSSEGVSALYAAAHFRPDRKRVLADDHFACELEFLQYLVNCEIEALRKGDSEEVARLRQEELSFIRQHPLRWVVSFKSEIESRAEVDFYPAIALMAEGWLADEAKRLEDQ